MLWLAPICMVNVDSSIPSFSLYLRLYPFDCEVFNFLAAQSNKIHPVRFRSPGIVPGFFNIGGAVLDLYGLYVIVSSLSAYFRAWRPQ